MRRIRKFIIILAAVFTLGTYITPSLFDSNAITVEAATKRKTVKEGMVTYTVYSVNHYFTPKQVRTIVNNYNKESSSGAIMTLKYALGMYPPIGFVIFARDLGNTGLIKPFKNAKAKGKGVRMKYDYWLSNTSHSVYKVKNKSITIQ